jgi:hypothetical protein
MLEEESALRLAEAPLEISRNLKLASFFQSQGTLRSRLHAASFFERIFSAGVPVVRVNGKQFRFGRHGLTHVYEGYGR